MFQNLITNYKLKIKDTNYKEGEQNGNEETKQ